MERLRHSIPLNASNQLKLAKATSSTHQLRKIDDWVVNTALKKGSNDLDLSAGL